MKDRIEAQIEALDMASTVLANQLYEDSLTQAQRTEILYKTGRLAEAKAGLLDVVRGILNRELVDENMIRFMYHAVATRFESYGEQETGSRREWLRSLSRDIKNL